MNVASLKKAAGVTLYTISYLPVTSIKIGRSRDFFPYLISELLEKLTCLRLRLKNTNYQPFFHHCILVADYLCVLDKHVFEINSSINSYDQTKTVG